MAGGGGEGRMGEGRTTYLVTGGAGFIGCNLADRLLGEGRRVIVLDDFSRPGSRLNVEWLQVRHGERLVIVDGDIRVPDAVRAAVADTEAVFHLAAQTAVTTSISDPRGDFDANLLGTLNVLEAAREASRPPAIVYASTNKVYGHLEGQTIVEEPTRYTLPDLPHGIPETAPLLFDSPYACSKGAADQYVLAYAQIYGIPAVVLRQSCIYGPRQMGVEDQGWAAWLLLAGVFGLPVTIYGDGKQVRDLLYVDDLIDAYLAAVEAIGDISGRAYNIGGGPAFSVSIWHEFSALLADLELPVPAVDFAAARPGDQRVFVSDNRRAARDFGFSPSTSPMDGIGRLAEWVTSAAPELRMLYPA